MKKYFLYNALFIVFISFLILGIRNQGFLIAEIIHTDPVYYIALLPLVLSIGIFGVAYQLFAINWKKWKTEWYKFISILITIYLSLLGVFISQIVLTTTFSLQLSLLLIPSVLIFTHIFVLIFKTIKNK